MAPDREAEDSILGGRPQGGAGRHLPKNKAGTRIISATATIYQKTSTMEQVNTLNILQHNIRHWSTIKISLSNTYRYLDPHIILINSHERTNEEKIKIFNYTIVQSNNTNTMHDEVTLDGRRE